jgi:hypothetical protein
MLVVVVLLPLSLAMDNGAVAKMVVDNGSGSGGGGGRCGGGGVRWRLMAAAAFNGGNATTSWRSERGAQQEDERVAQGEITQQPAGGMRGQEGGARRDNATTSWRDEKMRGCRNKRATRGNTTISWRAERMRGRHNKRTSGQRIER